MGYNSADQITQDTPVVVHFSGGKDSVATYLHLTRERGMTNVRCLFSDTGFEAPHTYEYLDLLERDYQFPITRIQGRVRDLWKGEVPERYADIADAPLTMETLCRVKKRFPSPTRRFCTEFLKLRPAAKWHAENTTPDTVIACGIRAEESQRRAQMATLTYDDMTGRHRWLPIFEWTVEDVFACHERHGIPRNPLYALGLSRVGCFPCIHARKSELAVCGTRYPQMFQSLRDMEKKVAAQDGSTREVMSYFGNSKTPSAYHSHIDPKSGKGFPDALDVWRWAVSVDARMGDGTLWEEPEDEDVFGLCDRYGACE